MNSSCCRGNVANPRRGGRYQLICFSLNDLLSPLSDIEPPRARYWTAIVSWSVEDSCPFGTGLSCKFRLLENLIFVSGVGREED